MAVAQYKRRAATHDIPTQGPRFGSFLPWTRYVTRRSSVPISLTSTNTFANQDSRNSRLFVIQEEEGSIADPHNLLEHSVENQRDPYLQLERKANVRDWILNRGGLNEDCYRSNVDAGIISPNSLRLHDLLTRQNIAKQIVPSSPVDLKELKQMFPGSIFAKNEREKCMSMVRANEMKDKTNVDNLINGFPLQKKKSDSEGFMAPHPSVPAFRIGDSGEGRGRFENGRYRYLLGTGSNCKERADELSRIGRESKIQSIDVGRTQDREAFDGDNRFCLDCLDEQCLRPGALCRRCQNARVNKDLAAFQRQAYDYYLETGKLARKPGDVVEVVNYQNDDPRRHRKIRGSIRKRFKRKDDSVSRNGKRPRESDDNDYDDDINHDYDNNDTEAMHRWNDYNQDGYGENFFLSEDMGRQIASYNEETEKPKKKKIKRSKKQLMELTRKASVDSWLKKRGQYNVPKKVRVKNPSGRDARKKVKFGLLKRKQ